MDTSLWKKNPTKKFIVDQSGLNNMTVLPCAFKIGNDFHPGWMNSVSGVCEVGYGGYTAQKSSSSGEVYYLEADDIDYSWGISDGYEPVKLNTLQPCRTGHEWVVSGKTWDGYSSCNIGFGEEGEIAKNDRNERLYYRKKLPQEINPVIINPDMATNIYVQVDKGECTDIGRLVDRDMNSSLGGNTQALCFKSSKLIPSLLSSINPDKKVITDLTMIEKTKKCPTGYQQQEGASFIGMNARCSRAGPELVDQKICVKKENLFDVNGQIVTDIKHTTPGGSTDCGGAGYIWVGDTRKGCGGNYNNICMKKESLTQDDFKKLCENGDNITTSFCKDVMIPKYPVWAVETMDKYCVGDKLLSPICENFIKGSPRDIQNRFDDNIKNFCNTKGVTLSNLKDQPEKLKFLCACHLQDQEYTNFINALQDKYSGSGINLNYGNPECLVAECIGSSWKNSTLRNNPCNSNVCVIRSEFYNQGTITGDVSQEQNCSMLSRRDGGDDGGQPPPPPTPPPTTPPPTPPKKSFNDIIKKNLNIILPVIILSIILLIVILYLI